MNHRMYSDVIRRASGPTTNVRHATFATVVAPTTNASRPLMTIESLKAKKKLKKPEHGRQIWVYSHLQKNHVVYSLTKALNNNASLRQLPYNGKKTVPSALRKDLWYPMATITFQESAGPIGLSAYQKLREYRKRHELEWNASMYKDADGKLVKKKMRGRMLCDQKANSVADIAAVLARLGVTDEADSGKRGNIGLTGEGKGEKVEVRWGNLKDAEFAETWTDNVEHGVLDMHTNNRDLSKPRGWRELGNDKAIKAEDEGGIESI